MLLIPLWMTSETDVLVPISNKVILYEFIYYVESETQRVTLQLKRSLSALALKVASRSEYPYTGRREGMRCSVELL